MMTRGFPYSVALHVLATVLILAYGNAVTRKPPRPIRAMNVKMVRLPETKPPEAQVENRPEPVVEQPKPEVKPDLPAKQKPEPEERKPVETKEPEPEVKAVEPEVTQDPPTESEPSPTPAVTVSGPSVSTDESDFPFAWYENQIRGLIWRNFDPRQVNFGKNAMVSCTIHFKIAKNGAVSQATLIRNSGVGVFDRQALRAVTTTRLPPLPPQYKGNTLGVTYTFNLEPGL